MFFQWLMLLLYIFKLFENFTLHFRLFWPSRTLVSQKVIIFLNQNGRLSFKVFFKISIYIPASESGDPVSTCSDSDGLTCDSMGSGMMDPSADSEGIEVVTMSDDVMFLEPVLFILAILHVNISFLILVAYYKLKVSHWL